MNTVIWTPQFPTEPGWYWFYGKPFGRVKGSEGSPKELLPAKAMKSATGIVCIAGSHFLYTAEASEYQFTPMIVPDLPE